MQIFRHIAAVVEQQDVASVASREEAVAAEPLRIDESLFALVGGGKSTVESPGGGW